MKSTWARWVSVLVVSVVALQQEAARSGQPPVGLNGGSNNNPGTVSGTAAVTNATGATPISTLTTSSSINPNASAQPYVSVWFNEMLKLAQAGISDGVMLSFIDSAGTFNLTAEQIVHLRDLGVSDAVIAAMMAHDFEVVMGLRPLASTAPFPSGPALPTVLTATAPAKTESHSDAGLVITRSDEGNSLPVEMTGRVLDVSGVLAYDRGGNQTPAPRHGSYPVREPHAVKLTEPILFVNAPGRAPNLLVIQSFP